MSFGIHTNFIKSKISKKILLIVASFLIIVSLIVIIFIVTNSSLTAIEKEELSPEQNLSYEVLWDKEDYQKVYDKSIVTLNGNPLDHQALMFNGFAAFYSAISQEAFEQKNRYLNEAIHSLRKALVIEPFRKNTDIFYILGKSYYHLGYFYHNESLAYLKSALENGHKSYDLFEYLGLIEANFNRYDNAADYFKRSLEINNRDLVNLALANTYDMTSNFDDALKIVNKVINLSKDTIALEKAYVKKADLLIKTKFLDEAILACNKALEINSASADAYFFLGEIFSSKGDTVKARAQWRQAFVLDSKHTGAISRLNS